MVCQRSDYFEIRLQILPFGGTLQTMWKEGTRLRCRQPKVRVILDHVLALRSLIATDMGINVLINGQELVLGYVTFFQTMA